MAHKRGNSLAIIEQLISIKACGTIPGVNRQHVDPGSRWGAAEDQAGSY